MMTRNEFRNFGNIRALISSSQPESQNATWEAQETLLLTEIKPLFQAPETAGMGNLGQHVY